MKMSKDQTQVYYLNDWYEIFEDQTGDHYIIYYDQHNNPHVTYLEDMEQ